jgi:hypothetical protein
LKLERTPVGSTELPAGRVHSPVGLVAHQGARDEVVGINRHELDADSGLEAIAGPTKVISWQVISQAQPGNDRILVALPRPTGGEGAAARIRGRGCADEDR